MTTGTWMDATGVDGMAEEATEDASANHIPAAGDRDDFAAVHGDYDAAAARGPRGSSGRVGPAAANPGSGGFDAAVADPKQRTGRPVEVRGRHRAVVELDVPGAWAVAHWFFDDARMRLPVVVDDLPASGPCRDAVQLLLSRVASALDGVSVMDGVTPTLVAGTAGAATDRAASELEAAEADREASGTTAAADAVERLTVAARMAVKEAEVLGGDEALARLYLERSAAAD